MSLSPLMLMGSACGGGGGGEGESGGSSTGDSEGTSQAQAQTPSDGCADAPTVAQGQFAGTLRDRHSDPELGGVCGGGGPDVFLRVQVPLRADLRVEARGNGFTPRVSLAPLGCLGAPMLACGADGIATLDDLADGTIVTLAIGVDADTFTSLSGPAPDDEPDPLDFVVDVAMTRVLAGGEVCMPEARGRCTSGTLCMPELTTADTDTDTAGDEDDAPWLCTTVPGDSCDAPDQVSVALAAGVGTLTIDPDLPQTDAHHHRCTGRGTRERVLRLRLPGDLEPQYDLQIHADRPEVGLAVRAPGCLASDELACAAPSAGGSRVTIAAPGALQRADIEPYLFVELPAPGVLVEPVTLHLRQVLRGPPVGAP
jgi:hypothetical protein